MFTRHSSAQLSRWLDKNRERALDAIALALRLQPGEVLHRLGVRLRDLSITPAPAPSRRPHRPRGRAPRVIDRERVLSSLRRHCGKHRAVAREVQVPRSTLSRFVAGLPEHAWIYGERIVEHHGALLAKSGVAPDVARARGYLSVSDGMLVPIWSERGVQMWFAATF